MKQKKAELIGVIHLPPLAGSVGSRTKDSASLVRAAIVQAVREAAILEDAGFDSVIIENFGDAPFYKDCVPPETVASMAIVASAVRGATTLAIGINVLRNDARAAIAIAATTGSQFVRVNVLSGVAATDQGLIEGRAAEWVRERERIARGIKIFADVHVKHAQSLSSNDISLAIEETAHRGGADAVIITGQTTGRGVDPAALKKASLAARALRVPLLIGSGATPESWSGLKESCDGVIVGSALRKSGRAGALLDARRCREFAKVFRRT